MRDGKQKSAIYKRLSRHNAHTDVEKNTSVVIVDTGYRFRLMTIDLSDRITARCFLFGLKSRRVVGEDCTASSIKQSDASTYPHSFASAFALLRGMTSTVCLIDILLFKRNLNVLIQLSSFSIPESSLRVRSSVV